jgi:hypothetical protein
MTERRSTRSTETYSTTEYIYTIRSANKHTVHLKMHITLKILAIQGAQKRSTVAPSRKSNVHQLPASVSLKMMTCDHWKVAAQETPSKTRTYSLAQPELHWSLRAPTPPRARSQDSSMSTSRNPNPILTHMLGVPAAAGAVGAMAAEFKSVLKKNSAVFRNKIQHEPVQSGRPR